MLVLSKLTSDLKSIMVSAVENFREPVFAMRETAVKSGEPLLERMGHTVGKLMGGHFGKRPFLLMPFFRRKIILVSYVRRIAKTKIRSFSNWLVQPKSCCTTAKSSTEKGF
jgi:hypothetical protein